jgi:hypothetical protein
MGIKRWPYRKVSDSLKRPPFMLTEICCTFVVTKKQNDTKTTWIELLKNEQSVLQFANIRFLHIALSQFRPRGHPNCRIYSAIILPHAAAPPPSSPSLNLRRWQRPPPPPQCAARCIGAAVCFSHLAAPRALRAAVARGHAGRGTPRRAGSVPRGLGALVERGGRLCTGECDHVRETEGRKGGWRERERGRAGLTGRERGGACVSSSASISLAPGSSEARADTPGCNF